MNRPLPFVFLINEQEKKASNQRTNRLSVPVVFFFMSTQGLRLSSSGAAGFGGLLLPTSTTATTAAAASTGSMSASPLSNFGISFSKSSHPGAATVMPLTTAAAAVTGTAVATHVHGSSFVAPRSTVSTSASSEDLSRYTLLQPPLSMSTSVMLSWFYTDTSFSLGAQPQPTDPPHPLSLSLSHRLHVCAHACVHAVLPFLAHIAECEHAFMARYISARFLLSVFLFYLSMVGLLLLSLSLYSISVPTDGFFFPWTCLGLGGRE